MKRILVIKLGALGDVIIATAHIERILNEHEQDEVWLLTGVPYGGLFAAHPRIKLAEFPRKGVGAMLQTLAWVIGKKFDVVYDLQGSERSAVISWMSRAAKRAGMGLRFPYTHSIDISSHQDEHIFDRLNRLLVCAGLPEAEPRPVLMVSDSEKTKVESWMKSNALRDKAFVLMHAGSSRRWPSKRWPSAYYATLAARLCERGLETVWVGAQEDAELNATLAAQGGIDATEVFSIAELSVLADHAKFAVVNDSGPMHVISAAGIPVYAFFGPTNWKKSHAVGQAGRILLNPVSCSPCHLGQCPESRGHRCLDELEPQTVWQRLSADALV